MKATASIYADSPRAANWLKVFGRLHGIPLLSEVPVRANLPGFELPQLVYLLDVTAMTNAERLRLVEHIAATFNYPAEEVARELDKVGCPLLAEDVQVRAQFGLFEFADASATWKLFDDDGIHEDARRELP